MRRGWSSRVPRRGGSRRRRTRLGTSPRAIPTTPGPSSRPAGCWRRGSPRRPAGS
jgi:hypothetical protein